MCGNALTLALRLTGMVAVALCIAVPAIGSGYSPTASVRDARAALTLRLDSALAPTFSEPVAPFQAAIKSERPRVGAINSNADALDPTFDIATDAGAQLQSAAGRLLASVDLPNTKASVLIGVESKRNIESISLDAVLVVDSIDPGGAQIELMAPFRWSLASAFEQDLVSGREHHLQIVASARGVDTRLNGKLVAEFESDEVTDLAAALVALQIRGIQGVVQDLSVTRERVLDDGRMRATLLSSNEGNLATIEQQLAAIDAAINDAALADAESSAPARLSDTAADSETPDSLADTAPGAPDATDAQAVLEPEITNEPPADATDTDSAELTDIDSNTPSDGDEPEATAGANDVAESDDPQLTSEENDGLDLDETTPVVADQPQADLEDTKTDESGEPERPSLGLFEMAGLDDDALDVKPEELLAIAENAENSAAESGPQPLIDGVQEPDEAPLGLPELTDAEIANAGSGQSTDANGFNPDPNDSSFSDPNAIANADPNINPDTGLPFDESILTDSEPYAANEIQNGADNRGLYQDDNRDYAEEPLPNFYEPEPVESAYIEPITNQDPLLAAIQRQQEEALLLQSGGGQLLDESHAPSEPLLEESVDEDKDEDALEVDEDATLVDQGSTTTTQPGFTEQDPTEDTSDTDSTTTGSTGSPTPVITNPSIPSTGLPTTATPVQPAVRSFFSFDPATSPDVVAWFRLDGSFNDERGVLSPLSNRGTDFDTDSFSTAGEPGNQRVRVEGSSDQLLGSADVQLLTFVGVTQRISVSAMIFVNEWESSILSSPTILQFGNNTGPGIELVDTNAGRQILGAGNVVTAP